ncbi:unnamed protein product [Oikopleura dioica]|uniref:Uncharacterized protein n=1 Tax=Oikopleura dioica TaxID=34765 RepID=E4Z5P3_OIKDI|nr:unnamed protein product [Oikopleura dioica]
MTTTHSETLPNEFWKHLGKFNLSEYSEPRWSILVNDMGLQCTLYWSSPHATPPSPPASPEKEANSQSISNTSSAALHKMLQQRLQQMNSKNLLLRNPITTVEVPTRPCSVGAKRKDSPPLPKPEIYGQVN